MGLIGGILQPLYGAFPVALMPPVYFLQKPLRWLKAISRYRGTTSGGPNFAYQLCVDKVKQQDLEGLDLSSWDVAFNGAEPIRAETLQQFVKSFAPYGFDPKAFYPCYGMAESTLIITGGQKQLPAVIRHWNKQSLETGTADPINETDTTSQATSLVSSGHSQLDHQVIVVDPETLWPCSHRTVGEIWVEGTSVAQGYWNGPKKTEQAFKAYLSDGTTGPFLRTGDLGFLDEDGELFVVGRLKDVLIIRGQNHYPHDIETTVDQSHKAIRSGHGAAISVEVKGTERLVIIYEVERIHLKTLNVSEVANAVRRSVTQQHQISPYAIVLIKTGSLPKTSSGKVKRYICREDFLANRLVVVDDWAETPTARSKFKLLQSDVDSILNTIPEESLPLTG
jgi:acyl-CoA synthetase (AMP-forming)/AMP-acid ligase II